MYDRKPIGFLERLTNWLIVKLLRSSYRQALHGPITILMMKTIYEEMQESFREDNGPTTMAFMVDCNLRGSNLPEDSSMYKRLKEIVG